MAGKELKATAKLFLDTSSAKQDAAQFVGDLKKKLRDIETAADKMSVFKDLVGYIGQVDAALTDLRVKNQDAFDHMFDGLDDSLRRSLENIFGMSGEQLGQFKMLREQMDSFTTKSSIKDVREFAKSINALYESVGKTPPLKLDEFSRTTKPKNIEDIKKAVNDLSVSLGEAQNRLKSGFGIGGGSGSGGALGGEADKIKQQIEDIKAQIAEYKRVKEELQKVTQEKQNWTNTKFLSDEFAIDYTVDAVKELVDTYNAAKAAKEEFEKSGDTSSLAYYENLAKLAKAALQIDDVYDIGVTDDEDFLQELKKKKYKKGTLLSSLENIKFSDEFEAFFDGDMLGGLNTAISQTESSLAGLQDKLANLRTPGNGSGAGNAVDNIGDSAEKAKQKIDGLNESLQLIEGDDGQFKMFDDVASGAGKAEAAVQELNDEIRKTSVLDGQMGFDDYLASKDAGKLSDKAVQDLDIDTSVEVAQLDVLKQKLLEVKAAIDAKTSAFEASYVTTDAAIEAEIDSLNRLKSSLEEVQSILQFVLPTGKNLFGDIEAPQDKASANSAQNIISSMQATLGQILGVLQGFTGIDSDGKNSIKKKEPVVDNNAMMSEAYALLAQKLPDNVATEGTLQGVKGAIENLASVVKAQSDSDSSQIDGTHQALNTLISALGANIKSLKDVMDGVIPHQKAQKSDTTKAMARIQDSTQFKQISSIAESSIGGLGTDVHIKSLKALANGLVGVEGAFKNVNGEWEGFTVKVNESNAAVDLAVNKQSAFAKVMRQLEEEMSKVSADDNMQKLLPGQTEAAAIIKAIGYDEEGKEVTVQYKDSQRYTVALKENIGGLQKEVFQTFDDSIEDFNERTTVTVSNKTAAAIRETHKLISESTKDIGNDDLLRKYNEEYDKLISMNDHYRSMDNLGSDDIDTWNNQITLVKNLGTEVSKLINQQQKYKKTTKDTDTKPDKFTKDLDKQKTDFSQYKQDVQNAAGVTDELRTKLGNLETELGTVGNADGLNKWQQSLKSLKTEISNVQKSFKSAQTALSSEIAGKSNSKFKELDFKATDNNLTQEQTNIVNMRKKLLQQIADYNIQVRSGQNVEISGIEETRDSLYQLIDAYKKKHNIENARGSSTAKTYGTNQLQTFTARYNSLMSGATEVGLDEQYDAVLNLTNAYRQLQAAQSAFAVGEDLTSESGQKKVAAFKEAQQACNSYARDLNKVVTASKKLSSDSIMSDSLAEDFEDSVNGRKAALMDFVNTMYGANASVGEFDDSFNKLSFSVKNGDGTFTKMTASINEAKTAIHATAGATGEVTGRFEAFFGELKGKFKSIGAYFAASMGWEEILQQVRQGFQYVRDIDAALTELKKVTNETDATYNNFLQSMSKTAGVVGSTVSDLTNMAADWSRLGYSLEDSAKLAESTAILLNVSEFQDATEASEALISTMQAFGYVADDSQHVVDILNEVGKLLPVDNYNG